MRSSPCLGGGTRFEDARRAVLAARCVGFENLTLDLMYGLPGQDMDRWEQSVRISWRSRRNTSPAMP